MAQNAAPTTPTGEPNYRHGSGTFGFQNHIAATSKTKDADFVQNLSATLDSASANFRSLRIATNGMDDRLQVVELKLGVVERDVGTLLANVAQYHDKMMTGFGATIADFDDMEETIAKNHEEVQAKFKEVDAKLVEMDVRLVEMDVKLKEIDAKIDRNHKEVDARFKEMDAKIDKNHMETTNRLDTLDEAVRDLNGTVTKQAADIAEILSLLRPTAPTSAPVPASTSLEAQTHPPIPHIQVSEELGAGLDQVQGRITTSANILQEGIGLLNTMQLRIKRSLPNMGRTKSHTS